MVWFGAGLKFLINNLISDLDVGRGEAAAEMSVGTWCHHGADVHSPEGAGEHVGLRNKELMEGVGRWAELRGQGWNCCG